MSRADCVALNLGAQRTASTPPRSNLRVPCQHAPLRPLATKLVRNPGLGASYRTMQKMD